MKEVKETKTPTKVDTGYINSYRLIDEKTVESNIPEKMQCKHNKNIKRRINTKDAYLWNYSIMDHSVLKPGETKEKLPDVYYECGEVFYQAHGYVESFYSDDDP